MPLVGFEPRVSAGERPQTYALDRAANGTGFVRLCDSEFREIWCSDSNNLFKGVDEMLLAFAVYFCLISTEFGYRRWSR